MTISNVMKYFYEICNIPHASGNTKALSDYCVSFAKAHDLTYVQDSSGNILIRKPATKGLESHPGVIFQGHLDMVAEKTADCSHDFQKDPLQLQIEGDFLSAKNTTLGGDDGIAIAYGLALLESTTIPHPPLEVLFTVDEEIGMLGANAFDAGLLQGIYFINCDSEEEGVLTCGCAGGVRADLSIPMEYVNRNARACAIHFDGFLGGHSGVEIHKEHANAHKIFGRLLYRLSERIRFSVGEVYGGTKDNVIAMQLDAMLYVEEEDFVEFDSVIASFQQEISAEYAGSPEHISIQVTKGSLEEASMLAPSSLETMVFLLMNLPDGVIRHNPLHPELVETSVNCGILGLMGDTLKIGCLIRSSIDSAKKAVFDQIKYLTEMFGGECLARGDYPGWSYSKDSHLRDVFQKSYQALTGKAMAVNTIHAGLECGLFVGKNPKFDCVSFGPDMADIHTVQERLSLSSTERTWNLLLDVLKNL